MESNGSETALKFPPVRSASFNHRHWNGDYGISSNDRRFAFSRNSWFRYSDPQSPVSIQRSNSFRPILSRSDSSIRINEPRKGYEKPSLALESDGEGKFNLMVCAIRAVSFEKRSMKRLALMISLNVAYSTTELMIGLFTERVVSPFAMATQRSPLDFTCIDELLDSTGKQVKERGRGIWLHSAINSRNLSKIEGCFPNMLRYFGHNFSYRTPNEIIQDAMER